MREELKMKMKMKFMRRFWGIGNLGIFTIKYFIKLDLNFNLNFKPFYGFKRNPIFGQGYYFIIFTLNII